MSNWLNLSRLRLGVQLLMLLVTVYGGNLVGYYMAEKISQNLPALSCAYDKQNGAYCVLIPLQHQLHHRVGEAIVQLQAFSLKVLLPLGLTLLSFYVFFVVLNKAFCGWVCPLGTVQELLYKAGRALKRPLHRLGINTVGRVRWVKWAMLGGLVLLLPLLTGMGVTPHGLGNPYCDVCPSRLATTLLTANTEELAIRTTGGIEYALGAAANTLFGFALIASLASRQPFCRICPMLAFHAMFRRLAFLRLVKTPHEKCGKCGVCAKACPMDIHEIHTESGAKAFHEDCTLCGRCAEFCPEDGVIRLKFGPLTLFRSSRGYYKARVKVDQPEGGQKVSFHSRREAAGD